VSSALELLFHRTRLARDEPEGALVLLHGRGTSELDLLPLLDELDPDARLFGVALRAPFQLPPGGFHWYAVPRVGYPDPDTFWASYRRLEDWLAALPDLAGVRHERTVLGGFSMGAVMSYALGMGSGRPPPAGVIALSGFIPTVEGFSAEPPPGLRVAVSHGTHDPIIPIDFARAARRQLEATEVDLLYHEAPMPHAVDPAFIPVLREWLGETIALASTARQ
jgi:phospholipase/carboxylesterase